MKCLYALEKKQLLRIFTVPHLPENGTKVDAKTQQVVDEEDELDADEEGKSAKKAPIVSILHIYRLKLSTPLHDAKNFFVEAVLKTRLPIIFSFQIHTFQVVTPWEIQSADDPRVTAAIAREKQRYKEDSRLFPTGQPILGDKEKTPKSKNSTSKKPTRKKAKFDDELLTVKERFAYLRYNFDSTKKRQEVGYDKRLKIYAGFPLSKLAPVFSAKNPSIVVVLRRYTNNTAG